MDEQTVPALMLKKPIDFNTVDEDNYQGGGTIGGSAVPDAEEGMRYTDLNPMLKSKADAILPFYGEETTVKIYHRRWQFREEGVKQFIAEMGSVFEKATKDDKLQNANTAILGTIVEIMKDKVQQIIMLSFDASEAYIATLGRFASLTAKSD